MGLAEVFVVTALQLTPFLTSFFLFYLCWSQKYILINLVHVTLHLTVCLPGHSTWTSCPNQVWFLISKFSEQWRFIFYPLTLSTLTWNLVFLNVFPFLSHIWAHKKWSTEDLYWLDKEEYYWMFYYVNLRNVIEMFI